MGNFGFSFQALLGLAWAMDGGSGVIGLYTYGSGRVCVPVGPGSPTFPRHTWACVQVHIF